MLPCNLDFVALPGFSEGKRSTPPNIGTAPGNILCFGLRPSSSFLSSLSASNKSSECFFTSVFDWSIVAGGAGSITAAKAPAS